ncbi:hypothetical protein FB451DRAFT_1568021 [Mycena latifolia]|nr:hypothetical protein FB451DRAFT_1568021 [Mycena latifolia]
MATSYYQPDDIERPPPVHDPGWPPHDYMSQPQLHPQPPMTSTSNIEHKGLYLELKSPQNPVLGCLCCPCTCIGGLCFCLCGMLSIPWLIKKFKGDSV